MEAIALSIILAAAGFYLLGVFTHIARWSTRRCSPIRRLARSIVSATWGLKHPLPDVIEAILGATIIPLLIVVAVLPRTLSDLGFVFIAIAMALALVRFLKKHWIVLWETFLLPVIRAIRGLFTRSPQGSASGDNSTPRSEDGGFLPRLDVDPEAVQMDGNGDGGGEGDHNSLDKDQPDDNDEA